MRFYRFLWKTPLEISDDCYEMYSFNMMLHKITSQAIQEVIIILYTAVNLGMLSIRQISQGSHFQSSDDKKVIFRIESTVFEGILKPALQIGTFHV